MRARLAAAAALLLAVTVTPAAVYLPRQIELLVQPAKHQPKRGPSRDRSIPGKARRRARKEHR